jgi:hypothetical protein
MKSDRFARTKNHRAALAAIEACWGASAPLSAGVTDCSNNRPLQ